MAQPQVTKEALAKEIKVILKGADLSSLSSKKVRKQLEEKHGTNLDSRKSEIDELVMKAVQDTSQTADESDQSEESFTQNHTEESDESEYDEPDDYEPAVKKTKKKKYSSSKDDAALAMELQEEENSRRTRTRECAKKSTPKVKRKSADGGEKKSCAEGGKKRKNNSYMKELNLSPELADIMGKDKMARSDVVKRMWQVIKERNLQDPKQKQFMLCDDQLLAIFGRKRVKTFGMMKYLNSHMFTETD